MPAKKATKKASKTTKKASAKKASRSRHEDVLAETDKKLGGHSGNLIGAGLLIGLGVGFLVGNIPAWMFIGLGVGMVLAYVQKRR